MSTLSVLAAGMAPGTWAELVTNGIADGTWGNDGTNNYNVFEDELNNGYFNQYTDEIKWDPVQHKAYFAGKEHGSAYSGGYDPPAHAFIHYQETGNNWRRMRGEEGGAPFDMVWGIQHAYDHMAMDTVRGEFIYMRPFQRRLYRWTVATETWDLMTEWPEFLLGSRNCCENIEYFPEIDSYIYYDGDWGVTRYNRTTNVWTVLHAGALAGASGIEGWIQYTKAPGQNGKMYMGKGGTIWRLSVTSPSGSSTPDSNLTLTRMPDLAGGWLQQVYSQVCEDPNTGNLIVLSSINLSILFDPQMFEYNITTETWGTLPSGLHPPFYAYKTGDAGPQHLGFMDGVEACAIPEYGVIMYWVYAARTNAKVWLYRHSPGAVIPPTIANLALFRISTPTPPSGAMTFDEKILTYPGKIRHHIMSTTDTGGQAHNNPGKDICCFVSSGDIPPVNPVFDPTMVASGHGTLRFEQVSQSGSGSAGQWSCRFTPNNEVTFGEGETFNVQWMEKRSRYHFEHIYNNSHGFKHIILGRQDLNPAQCNIGHQSSICGTSDGELTLVLENTNQHGVPIMYDAADQPFYAYPSTDPGGEDRQPRIINPAPGTYCKTAQTAIGNLSNCFAYKDGLASPLDPNTLWNTMTIQVSLGALATGLAPGSATPQLVYENSNIKAWGAWEGQPAFKWLDYTVNIRAHAFAPNPPPYRYGRLWLLIYQSAKDFAEVHESAFVWYGNIIIASGPVNEAYLTTA